MYKHYLVHPAQGTIPSHAACAAHLQGKFHEMHEAIWEKGFKAGRNLSLENMEKIAGELGLNMAKFKTDMNGACPKLVQAEQAEMAKVGVSGTPAFFINGRYLSGAQPIDNFKRLIDEELKKANERIAKGEATPANYYDKFVLANGLKEVAKPSSAEAPAKPGAAQPPGPPPPGKTTWSAEHGHWH